MAPLGAPSDTDGNAHIASFIPGEEKEGWSTGGWLFTAPDTQDTNTQVTAKPRVFPAPVISQHPALGVHAALGEVLCGAETGETSINPPFWLHKNSRVVTCPETSGAKCALVVQEEKQTETQVVRILIFGIVAVEVLVALFLVLLKKKLHRHKLKTIFNFKMT